MICNVTRLLPQKSNTKLKHQRSIIIIIGIRGFKLWDRYQKLRLSRERREKLYSEQKRKEEEKIRKEKERIKAIAKRKSQVHMLNLHGASLRMVGKFGSIVTNMKSENLNIAGRTAKSIIGRLGQ